MICMFVTHGSCDTYTTACVKCTYPAYTENLLRCAVHGSLGLFVCHAAGVYESAGRIFMEA